MQSGEIGRIDAQTMAVTVVPDEGTVGTITRTADVDGDGVAELLMRKVTRTGDGHWILVLESPL